MRAVPAFIQDVLTSGVFVGETKNSARVTVEPDWWLNIESTDVGNWPFEKRPVRWWQRADNSQEELELPNVVVIDLDESIDNAAAAATISVLNQKMRSNVTFDPKIPTELGQPGYYTAWRGDSLESRARWNQVPNDWNHVLVPNALLRTYEGFGGHSKPLAQAIADGHVQLTGVWLVDDVSIATGGKLELKCRNMMKLLIEQQLFPPLIPLSRYPLAYARWKYNNVAINAHGIDVGTVTKIEPGDRQATLADSSVDHWYPQASPGSSIAIGGYPIHGHKAGDAFDGDESTYWLGEGNSGADKPFAVNFLEVDCGGEAVDAIFVHPWGGDYTMYISVLENGIWQGTDVVPYDPSILFGTQPYAVDTGAAIPYLSAQGVPWETPKEYALPRVYAASKVRISFRHLADSGIGPWRYRAGVREFRVRIGGTGAQTGSVQHIDPIFYAATSILVPSDSAPTGYLTASHIGQIDAFGDARLFDQTGGDDTSNAGIVSVAFTPTRRGYYVLRSDGRVSCYGDAVFHGSPHASLVPIDNIPNGRQNIFADILVTHTGAGYWITRWGGEIRSYGDAPTYPAVTGMGNELLGRACAHPTAYGLFMITSAGVVHVRGAAVHVGNWSPAPALGYGQPESAGDIQCTSTGNGYWLLSTAGRVQAKGGAGNWGQITTPVVSTSDYERYWEILPAPTNLGYLLLRGDGTIFPKGDVEFFGGPASGSAQLRSDGDYTDYVQIIEDLVMWSGWFLKESLDASTAPSVFGELEATGAYSNDPLPADLFDKHPVIDAINAIKEIVGYLVQVRYDGGFKFFSPNWWEAGNFDEDGNHITTVPEIDERVDLTSYGIRVTDRPVRSQILISSQKIDPTDSTAQYARYIPSTARLLRGMVKPAMWVDAHFIDIDEEKLMAELIALHIWFQVRTGQATGWINPAVQLNDQVRILERETSESFVHYVRGRHTVNDVQQGTYTMVLTTNWLGDRENWVITPDTLADDEDLGRFQVSQGLLDRFRAAKDYLSPSKVTAARLYDSPVSQTGYAAPNYTDEGNQAGPP